MRLAADRLREATDGQVELKVFPDSGLGGDGDMLSQVRSGALESLLIAGLITSTLVPTAAINGMGFAFSDYATVWQAMDGEVGSTIRAAIEKAHLVVMEQVWDNGFRQITSSSTRIEAPRDLVGLKLRVPGQPALHLDVPQARGRADRAEPGRDLFRAADPSGGRPGEPAGRHRNRQIL